MVSNIYIEWRGRLTLFFFISLNYFCKGYGGTESSEYNSKKDPVMLSIRHRMTQLKQLSPLRFASFGVCLCCISRSSEGDRLRLRITRV